MSLSLIISFVSQKALFGGRRRKLRTPEERAALLERQREYFTRQGSRFQAAKVKAAQMGLNQDEGQGEGEGQAQGEGEGQVQGESHCEGQAQAQGESQSGSAEVAASDAAAKDI